MRFYGCNLTCRYCDTVQASYRTFTPQGLLSRILDLGDDYNELAITGGEPLLHAEFLAEFLPFYKRHKDRPVYLETNGTLPEAFERISDRVDIVAMDVKLPSSTQDSDESVWEKHGLFLEKCVGKELAIKAVITGSTVMADIKKLSVLLQSFSGRYDLVLQPVTPEDGSVEPPDEEMLTFFKGFLEQKLSTDIIVMGQLHKFTGIR